MRSLKDGKNHKGRSEGNKTHWVVRKKGRVVEPAHSLVDVILKKYHINQVLDFLQGLGQILMDWLQIQTYAMLEWFRDFLDQLVRKFSSLTFLASQ